jgi:ribonuclease HII
VVAAAVIVDPSLPIPGVDDSKVVSPERRERLAELIRTTAVAWSVVDVAPAIIDRINILEATKRAMVEALDNLRPAPDCVLVDAVSLPPRQCPCMPLVRGDSFSYAIACASILAKVERDRGMRALDRDYPQYGFADNKGYGADEHRRALAEFGPSPAHRLTFRSVVPRVSEAGQ